MNKRWVAVGSTVLLSFLALPASYGVRASAVSTSRKQPVTSASRASADGRARNSRTATTRNKRACAPCAVAKKSRSLKKGARTAKNLPCHPKNYVDPKLARNYRSALRDMKRAGIKPKITSVYRSSRHQAQLHRCSLSTRCRRANPGLYRALPPGSSMHEAGFAVDIAGIASGPRGNKKITPRGRRIVGIMRKNGFKWRYGLKDPAHFEADPRRFGYRNSRQAIARTQTTCQFKVAKSKKRAGNKLAVRTGRPDGRARMTTVSSSTKATRRPVKLKA